MPLPAARRREVRASRRDEPNYPTKRCLNCPKFFKQTKPHKKFCSTQCKDQFNKFGGAYGKLKEKLFAEIHAQVKRETFELRDIVSRLILALPTDVYLKFQDASPEAKKK